MIPTINLDQTLWRLIAAAKHHRRLALGGLAAFTVICAAGLYSPVSPYDAGSILGIKSSSPKGFRIEKGVLIQDKSSLSAESHPIYHLLAEAEERAVRDEELQEKTSTLEGAFRDYVDAYGMNPPEGFDEWFYFARSNSLLTAPSYLPLVHNKVLPFLALPAHLLRSRVRETMKQNKMFGLVFDRSQEETVYSVEVDPASSGRFPYWEWPELSKGIMQHVPLSQQPDEPVTMAIWVDDTEWGNTDGAVIKASSELARKGQVWDEEDLKKLEQKAITSEAHGWGQQCVPARTDRDASAAIRRNEQTSRKAHTFISDTESYLDVCEHPELLKLNGDMITKGDRGVAQLVPVMAVCSPRGGANLVGPATYGYNYRPPDTIDIDWDERDNNKLYWRGSPTGAFIYEGWDWESGQRFRLQRFMNEKSKEDDYLSLLVSDSKLSDAGPQLVHYDRNSFMEDHFDIRLVGLSLDWTCGSGGSHQFFCQGSFIRKEMPNCPMNLDQCRDILAKKLPQMASMSTRQQDANAKFRLDIDGFGWTTRFRSELLKNNVLFKITVYDEWWTKQIIPWYHYIPARYDFYDLPDIMAFFNQKDENPDESSRVDMYEEAQYSDTLADTTENTAAEENIEAGVIIEEIVEGADPDTPLGRRGIPPPDDSLNFPERDLWLLKPNTTLLAKDLTRDMLAKRIAARGRQFALNRLGWEPMQSYQLLLLLEYRRAWSDDRDAATFRL